ncbi:Preprotein translocase subunit YajC [Mucinivorans hirudinis]|uniref:Sec translocon accessory complex subunit YajC n=1 Tax=Mucinivorans hirudinis TaxID=1433126 RepID=A0A060R8C7_9BACT|nr:Preprotein translocase subunit YajC [Mucinivorans hirudinis]
MTINTFLLQAESAESAAGGGFQMIIMMVLIFGVMYFLMIRPQQKRQKELNKFRNTLEKGTKIITAGGIYGVIKEVKETSVLIEVDSNVTLRVDKTMVMRDASDAAAAAQQQK